MTEASVVIGCAGYSFPHWEKGVFYPNSVKSNEHLQYYSKKLPGVEINNTFHGIPKEDTFHKWAKESSAGFVFALKANQDITHKYKLSQEGSEKTQFMFDRAREALGEKFGPILFQLPPSFSKDTHVLQEFCSRLPAGLKAAFEFRHKDWYCDEVYAILRSFNASIVENVTMDNSMPTTDTITANFTYLRFHKSLDTENVTYPTDVLRKYAERIVERRKQGLEQHLYFMNDVDGNGPRNACELLTLANDINGGPVAPNWKPKALVGPGTKGSLDSFFKKAKPAAAAAPAPTPTSTPTPAVSAAAKQPTPETSDSPAKRAKVDDDEVVIV